MNTMHVLALMLAAGSQSDEWADAPVVTLEAQPLLITTTEAEPKAAAGSRAELLEYPEGPPLTAEKQPDGSLLLRHRRLEDKAPAASEEESPR